MCGIAGFCHFKRDNNTEQWAEAGRAMGETLNHRGPDDKGLFQVGDAVLVHRRLAVIDPEHGRQPMTRKKDEISYTICYNGELYNTADLRSDLLALGFTFETSSDTEVLLCAYIAYGEDVGRHLEGIYAFTIWDEARRQLFCCRDRFGVKPFFYTSMEDAFVFGSELKALFAYPGIVPRVEEDGWCEVLGLGPARTLGNGVFAGISELLPAHCLVVSPSGTRQFCYWRLESREHTDDYEQTVSKVKELVSGAISRQLVSDVPLCTFLSGGLDSSVITAVAARDYASRGLPPLETYSFDYTDNETFFTPSAFQPDDDRHWVKRMREEFPISHTVLTCDIEPLVALLDDAVLSKDLPGMADVDSSLLYFCRQVSDRHVVALSGECSDEVFGGYPWFERSEMLFADTFPWSRDLSPRSSVFAPMWETFHIADYVQSRYRDSVAQTPRLPGEQPEDARRREVAWLNLRWFMTTLLDRKDRMSMASGLEVRVPFCDHRLVEYVFNIPWSMKAKGGVRKQVLRDAAAGLLPEDVRLRPKSPYPKTHNPLYTRLVAARVTALLEENTAPVCGLLDRPALRAGLLSDSGDLGKPWFGQLMAGPQMLAYLLQLNRWMLRFGITV
ncbi:MAG: asparagine synthase (glutamine-hydrolyzing) [Oscillospiraceae bacterium]|nr:asparagine synthase (glutamine-hydrolyzing) [Oscillospiraceae bacterium]